MKRKRIGKKFGGLKNRREYFGKEKSSNFSTSVSNLPSSLILEVITKLPIKSISRCRCVCKTWKNLISDKYFSTLYLKNSPFTVLLNYVHPLILAEIGGLNNENSQAQINVPIRVKGKFLKYSCNGFLCLVHRQEIVYVVNPLIGEVVRLPELPCLNGYRLIYSFGFCKQSNHYKVLRIAQPYKGKELDEGHYMFCDIFTIGVDLEWRSFEYSSFTFELQLRHLREGGEISHEGVAYFICYKGHNLGIFAFDLEKEKGSMILPPFQLMDQSELDGCKLSLYDGNVCLFYRPFGIHENELIVIWTLKQCGKDDSWSRQAIMYDGRLPIEGFDKSNVKKLSFVTKFRDGDLLLARGICYNVKTEKFRKLINPEALFFGDTLFAYIPNFLPLSPDPLQKYRESLNLSNCLDILEISEECSNQSLKESTLDFILRNMEDVLFSTRYETFAHDNPHLAVQISRASFNDTRSNKA